MFCAPLCFVNARNTLAAGDDTSASTTVLLTNTCRCVQAYLDRHQAKNLEFSTIMTNVTRVLLRSLSRSRYPISVKNFAFDPRPSLLHHLFRSTHAHTHMSRRVRALKGQQTYLNGVRPSTTSAH